MTSHHGAPWVPAFAGMTGGLGDDGRAAALAPVRGWERAGRQRLVSLGPRLRGDDGWLAALDRGDGLGDPGRMGPSLAHRIRTEAHAVWLAVRDPRTPLAARILGVLVAAYALSPIDLIPDFIPVLGLVDDAILIPIGVWLFERMVPPALFAEYRAKAEAETRRPVSWAGVLIVVILWAGAALLIWSALAQVYD